MLAMPNSMRFLSDDDGETYNLCHMWSNFEIGNLKFWRSEAYRKYFDSLDQAGGFFYERWGKYLLLLTTWWVGANVWVVGDAPVHSIAAGLFLKPSELHFFEDIGCTHLPVYRCRCPDERTATDRHGPYQHCPKNRPQMCACDPADSFG